MGTASTSASASDVRGIPSSSSSYIAADMDTKEQLLQPQQQFSMMSHVLDHFSEGEYVMKLLNEAATATNSLSVSEFETPLIDILEKYQEQPQLLDKKLDFMITSLTSLLTTHGDDISCQHSLFRLIYTITKVRGYKTVVKCLPHEVSELEPKLAMLLEQDANDHETWQTRYILLLWLSIICLMPFDMKIVDSGRTGDASISFQIVRIAKRYLSATDKSRDAAAVLLARVVTRPDMKDVELPCFLVWAKEIIHQLTGENVTDVLLVTGIYAALAAILKLGKREDLLNEVERVFEILDAKIFEDSNNPLLRKFATKLITRVGMIYLRPRLASWRYQRGSRSLAHNLRRHNDVVESTVVDSGSCDIMELDDDQYDIPDAIEDVIERLLAGLRDADTIVRWSAAKGIGRITGRLPLELADDVLESILELFGPQETDSGWHGGCLALAELARRCLLLPRRLPTIVPVILKALLYDVRRSSYSVGAHVRDSACYVCWAFARAYAPDILRPYVNELAYSLIITMVFDREVNCRRAASAAFQENVGRQGTFPNGIDITTIADFVSVGNRSHAFLTVAPAIAKFSIYLIPMINHLCEVKTRHWDRAVRDVTAKAVSCLTPLCTDHIANHVLGYLLPRCTGTDLYERHGSILVIAAVIEALAVVAREHQQCLIDIIPREHIIRIVNLIGELNDKYMFRGLGGELMQEAICILVASMAASDMPLLCSGDSVSSDIFPCLLDQLKMSIFHVEESLQAVASDALGAICRCYLPADSVVSPWMSDGTGDTHRQDTYNLLLKMYMEPLLSESSVFHVRRGCVIAISALPAFILEKSLLDIVGVLCDIIEAPDRIDYQTAETRKQCVLALGKICETVGVKYQETGDITSSLANSEVLDLVLRSLYAGSRDYTIDSRGDVGSWIREAAMVTLVDLAFILADADDALLLVDTDNMTSSKRFFNEDFCKFLCCTLVQQSLEKIDRTRAIAAGLLMELLYPDLPCSRQNGPLICRSRTFMPFIPHITTLKLLFPRDSVESFNFSASSDTFPKFALTLGLDVYRECALLGLIVSVGGLTESVVIQATSGLMNYLQSCIENELDSDGVPRHLREFCAAFIAVWNQHKRNDRITIPILKTLNILLSENIFEFYVAVPDARFPIELLDILKIEISKCGNVKKLIEAINVLCGMVQFPLPLRKRVFSQICLFLGFRWPKVRKHTADQLMYALLLYGDAILDDENANDVQELLNDTLWDDMNMEYIRSQRNQVCDLLAVPQPKLKNGSKNISKNEISRKDDFASYDALVRTSGF